MTTMKFILYLFLAPLFLAGLAAVVTWVVVKWTLIGLWKLCFAIAKGLYFLYLWPVHIAARR